MASRASALGDGRPTTGDEQPADAESSRGGQSSVVRRRGPGPLRLAFSRTVQDWWYGLIPFGAVNIVWLALVLTIVGGPPATAAMLGVARDAAAGEGVEPKNYFIYLRRYFWRSWGLGIISALVTVILVTDLHFYTDLMSGNPILQNTGLWFLYYVLIVWLEVLLVAWAVLVDQPEMSLRDVVRNAAVLTLRMPGAGFGLAILVLLLSFLSLAFGILLAVALAAFVALLAQHYLHIQAPVLADFPVLGEGVVEPEPEDETEAEE